MMRRAFKSIMTFQPLIINIMCVFKGRIILTVCFQEISYPKKQQKVPQLKDAIMNM